MDKEYTVEIVETRKAKVTIKAADAREALQMAQWLYDNDDIILTSLDWIDTKMDVVGHLLP